MNSDQKKIVTEVYVQISGKPYVTEEELKGLVDYFRVLDPISDDEIEEIIKELQSRLRIKMDRGAYLKEKNHIPWYNAAKKDISLNAKYWDRYRQYLINHDGFAVDVLDKLEIVTDEIMDLLGNPKSHDTYSRKGLVIGDVQSGKTSTYTGLINKATDAGYRIIIVLTGTIEKLRKQTQARLDAGFVGIDSAAFMKDKQRSYIGVGEINQTAPGWSLTSIVSDFNTRSANQYNGQLANVTAPVLFVLKKNKSVLEKLEQWLRLHNANVDGKIESPLLLIDDEADNASINTKKEEEKPSAINASIRTLLKLFVRSNYVAFTATPYANIFIDPDSDDEMIGEELFPRDFIYALPSPSNYIGPESVFGENGEYHYMLKQNDDCESFLPEKHKIDADVGDLPISLKKAIVSFFIINTIRDLRKHTTAHRTMLINISRFINVQDKIMQIVNSYVRSLQREIQNYSKTGDRALQHHGVAFIKEVFDVHFSNLKKTTKSKEKYFSWEEILETMSQSVSPIVVRSVNGGNASKNLDYDENESLGLRLIAIGGYSLSRGLTLEGLCVSYFYRNSKMYDTLMQMGRWFGYRNHYADLCQIWMTLTSINWYKEISESTAELKRDVKKMQDVGLTPINFGLGVRSNQEALIVTAVNKMRYAESVFITLNMNGAVIETPYIDSDPTLNSANFDLVNKWIYGLADLGIKPSIVRNGQPLALSNKFQFLDVPKNYIIELLNFINVDPFNYRFVTSSIIETTEKYNELDKWDMIIATGSGNEHNFGGFNVKPIVRSFEIKEYESKKVLMMNGSKLRLGSTSFAMGGITKQQKESIEKNVMSERSEEDKNKSFTQNDYFKYKSLVKRNPLLIIYLVQLNTKNSDDKTVQVKEQKQKELVAKALNYTCLGFAVGIPNNGESIIYSNYTVNKIKYHQILGISDDDILEETGEDND